MIILLPMDSDDTQEAKLVPIFEAKKWAVIPVEEGEVVEIKFYDKREDISEWVEAVVVVNDFEPVMDFIDNQVMVLVAHTQRSIDDIVEAYLFRELHDLAI